RRGEPGTVLHALDAPEWRAFRWGAIGAEAIGAEHRAFGGEPGGEQRIDSAGSRAVSDRRDRAGSQSPRALRSLVGGEPDPGRLEVCAPTETDQDQTGRAEARRIQHGGLEKAAAKVAATEQGGHGAARCT